MSIACECACSGILTHCCKSRGHKPLCSNGLHTHGKGSHDDDAGPVLKAWRFPLWSTEKNGRSSKQEETLDHRTHRLPSPLPVAKVSPTLEAQEAAEEKGGDAQGPFQRHQRVTLGAGKDELSNTLRELNHVACRQGQRSVHSCADSVLYANPPPHLSGSLSRSCCVRR